MTDAWRHNELIGWEPPQSDELFGAGEVRPRVTNALGIDVASYQGSPNWQQVASKVQFAYIKSGQGTGTSYPSLDSQWQGANAAGLTTGLYWYADPSQTAQANAAAFAAQINRLGAIEGHLPPCLDIETGSGSLSSWVQQFISALRADTGCVRVMIYASASFFRNQVTEAGLDSNVALWIADWSSPPGSPSYMSPRVALHQYADNGQVTGINGAVDLDLAIWPLSTIVPGATGGTTPVTTPSGNNSVFTPAEEGALLAIYQQLSGSPTVGQWTGWPSFPGGSGKSLTPVDYLRTADVILNTLQAEMLALKAELDMLKSAVDPAQIAAAVAQQLASKLAS